MSGYNNLPRTEQRFMGSLADYPEASAVIFGIPMDFTVSFRPGSRSGPQKIREVSYGIEEYSPYLDAGLGEASFYDWGDLELPIGNVGASLDVIYGAAKCFINDGKFPIGLGGEHLVSLPLIKAVQQKYPGLVVVHFDAHADLREDYLGQPLSHASVIRRVSELVGAARVYQFGIRSGTRDEFAFGRANTNFYPFEVCEPLRRVLPELKGKPVYVTLDIDVVDPAFAPGTGTPEPGGCTAAEILTAMHLLRELDLVGFDLVEVCPVYDQSERTSLLAAKLIREVILGRCQVLTY